MSDSIQVQAINFDEIGQAFEEAPLLAFKFARQEMGRFGSRTRKKFIRDQLSGPPGIKWGSKKKIGKNVRADVTGSMLDDLTLTMAISRILKTHEKGTPITPKDGKKALVIPVRENIPHKPGAVPGLFKVPGMPFLAIKKPDGRLKILYVLARRVRMKKRLSFVKMVQDQSHSDLRPRLLSAVKRAVRVAAERRTKAISSSIAGFGNSLSRIA